MDIFEEEDFEPDYEGMTLVDGYLIPNEELEEYVADRNRFREILKETMKKWCSEVYSDFEGSQDGEAILGKDTQGNYTRIFHLDPQGIEDLKQAEKDGDLENFIDESSK